jgi:hypothetical protein
MNKKLLKTGGIAALIAAVATAGALSLNGTVAAQSVVQPVAASVVNHMGGGRMGAGAEEAVAKALGIDVATLRSELQAGKTLAALAKEKNVEISVLVEAILTSQRSTLTDAITNGTFMNGRPGGRGGRGEMGGRGGMRIDHVGIAATALGMDATALRTELTAGKTFAQVAESKGVAPSKITDAWVAEYQKQLSAAVTAGTITQADADAKLANAKTRATELLTSNMPQRGPGRNRGGLRGAPQQPVTPPTTSG